MFDLEPSRPLPDEIIFQFDLKMKIRFCTKSKMDKKIKNKTTELKNEMSPFFDCVITDNCRLNEEGFLDHGHL